MYVQLNSEKLINAIMVTATPPADHWLYLDMPYDERILGRALTQTDEGLTVADDYPDSWYAEQVRSMRYSLLKRIDALVGSPLRWAGYTTDVQDEVAVYRQELLDITLQPGFPRTVVWPRVPECLK